MKEKTEKKTATVCFQRRPIGAISRFDNLLWSTSNTKHCLFGQNLALKIQPAGQPSSTKLNQVQYLQGHRAFFENVPEFSLGDEGSLIVI